MGSGSGAERTEEDHWGGVFSGLGGALRLADPLRLFKRRKLDRPKVDLPRRQKSAPSSPPTGSRVSAALFLRDAGDRRASLGDAG